MDIQQSQQAKQYLDLFLRRKILILSFLLLSLPVGLGVYLKTPKVYMATSLLSYQQQKINPNTMSPDVVGEISDIVSTLTQIVISRTNLENIITNLKLYSEAREILPMEDVIEIMALANVQVSKYELSAFSRKPHHYNYRECKNQFLLNFLEGVQLKHRDNVQS